MSDFPETQSSPLPDLGSHFPLVEDISSRCEARMSFLQDRYTDLAAWQRQARAKLQELMAYSPHVCDFNPEVVERADRGSFVRERVMISLSPETRIPVYVLIPKDATLPAPGIVALHDHGGFYLWGKEKVVGTENEHPALTKFKQAYGGRSFGDEFAKAGFVVIASDMLHWGERRLTLDDDPPRFKERSADLTEEDVQAFNRRSWLHEELLGRSLFTAGATWSGVIAHDDRRVTDYLLTRPEVDPSRMGCLGLSVGAVRTVFLGALHPAIKASIPVCWMAEYQGMIRNNIRSGIGFTKLVPGLYNHLDWPDVCGLHAPNALMVINGLQDALYPLDAANAAVEKIGRVYGKAGCPEKFEGVFFDGPHEFNVEMQERALEFMRKWLA